MAIVKKLLHTRYRVDDLETSVKFYTEVLGLTETRRHKSPRGSELVFLATPNSDEEIELCSYPSSGGVQVQEDLTHLAFEVESLVEFEKHIQSLGVEYSDGPHMKDSGGGFAFAPPGGGKGGGGRPDMAQAGGSDASKVDEAISEIKKQL